jgi:hypothetical protein
MERCVECVAQSIQIGNENRSTREQQGYKSVVRWMMHKRFRNTILAIFAFLTSVGVCLLSIKFQSCEAIKRQGYDAVLVYMRAVCKVRELSLITTSRNFAEVR